MEVTLRRQRLRCALCHDEAVGHLVRCRFCGVFMHTECKAEFGRCPSLGCVVSCAANGCVAGGCVVVAMRFAVRSLLRFKNKIRRFESFES